MGYMMFWNIWRNSEIFYRYFKVSGEKWNNRYFKANQTVENKEEEGEEEIINSKTYEMF